MPVPLVGPKIQLCPVGPNNPSFALLSHLSPQFDVSTAKVVGSGLARDGGSLQLRVQDSTGLSLSILAPAESLKMPPTVEALAPKGGSVLQLPQRAELGGSGADEVAAFLRTLPLGSLGSVDAENLTRMIGELTAKVNVLSADAVRYTVNDPAAAMPLTRIMDGFEPGNMERTTTSGQDSYWGVSNIAYRQAGHQIFPTFEGNAITYVDEAGRGTAVPVKGSPKTADAVVAMLEQGASHAQPGTALDYDNFLVRKYEAQGAEVVPVDPRVRSALQGMEGRRVPEALEALAAEYGRPGVRNDPSPFPRVQAVPRLPERLKLVAAAVRGYQRAQVEGLEPSPVAAQQLMRGTLGQGVDSQELQQILMVVTAQPDGFMLGGVSKIALQDALSSVGVAVARS